MAINLDTSSSAPARPAARPVVLGARQRGVVLFIALICLVALSLAGIALMRSVGSGILVAGNLGFKRATIAGASFAIESARNTLLTAGIDTTNDSPALGYWSTWGGNAGNPGNLDGTVNVTNADGGAGWSPNSNIASASWLSFDYVIHRMCDPNLTPPGSQASASLCVVPPANATTGSNLGVVDYSHQQLSPGSSAVYFRVTVAIFGPRNSVSHVQAMLY